jgi:hypothetical protein
LTNSKAQHKPEENYSINLNDPLLLTAPTRSRANDDGDVVANTRNHSSSSTADIRKSKFGSRADNNMAEPDTRSTGAIGSCKQPQPDVVAQLDTTLPERQR